MSLKAKDPTGVMMGGEGRGNGSGGQGGRTIQRAPLLGGNYWQADGNPSNNVGGVNAYPGTGQAPGLGATAPAAPTAPTQQSPYNQMILDQINRLIGYYDVGDPETGRPMGQYARNMATNSINAVQRSGMGRGISGPMMRTAGLQASANALQGVAGMRDAAVGQMLGLGSGRDVDLQRLSQNQSQFDADMAMKRRSLEEDTRRYNQQWTDQTNPWNRYVMPLLSGLLGAGGQVAGAYLGRPPGLGNVPGQQVQNPAFPSRGTQGGGEPVGSAGW